jgi:hypothetical protein
VGGAGFPQAAELPQEIQALVRRNALELSDTRFRDDVSRLIQALERNLAQSAPEPRQDAPPALADAAPSASPLWRAELLNSSWWRRALRVHLSHESHTIDFENTWDTENVRVDGVIVAQRGSLTTRQEAFAFQVSNGPLQYAASIGLKPNVWLSTISAFRLSIHGRVLYQGGNCRPEGAKQKTRS